MMSRTQFLLLKVAEECAEVSQRALKAAQFGLWEVQPGQDGASDQWEDNAHRLLKEYADLIAVLEMLESEAKIGLNGKPLIEWIAAKKLKLERYYKYSVGQGMVEADPRLCERCQVRKSQCHFRDQNVCDPCSRDIGYLVP